ncbi:MAG: hypothetical protein ABIB46_01260 [bacterium]
MTLWIAYNRKAKINNLGKEVSSGMYFYETIVDNKTLNCKKMLMLK